MIVILCLLLAGTAGTLLALRKPDRFRLSVAALSGIFGYVVLGILQGAVTGSVRFDEHTVTVLYVALPVWVGVLGGPVEGLAVPVFALGPVLAIALLFGSDSIGSGREIAQAAAQAGLAAMVLGLIGVVAGLARRWLIGAACAALLWPLFLLSVHVDALRGYSPWIATLAATGVALMGLVVNDILRSVLAARRGATGTGAPG